jgi:glycosyltransferase involved in cell wall biosynthesis
MRIAIVNWSSRRVGGIEEYLSLAIPALHEAGHDVAFWHEMDVPDDRPTVEVPAGVVDICASRVGMEAAIAAVRQWKPDVVYVHGMRDIGVEKRLLGLGASVYFVHTYTGTCITGAKTFTKPSITPCDRAFGWPCLVQYFPRGCGGRSPITMWRQFAQQSQQLALLQQYSAVLTHTAHIRDEMTRHGVPAAVVSYPVRSNARPTTKTRATGPWRLLFAGRMTRLKGGEYLVDALPTVAAALDRPVHLAFAGDGSERGVLAKRASEIAAASSRISIDFLGWLDSDRVSDVLSATDLLVVPSVWPEPFGSVGPAAASYGVPSAAFDVGGISEWLLDGVSGHLAPGHPPTADGLAAAILKCLADPSHYDELKTGSLNASRRFTMARHLSELLPMLQQAVDRHQRS